MRRRYVALSCAVAGAAALIGGLLPAGAGTAPITEAEFVEPGSFEFPVPADVCEITVEANGASGGTGSNGDGLGQTGGTGGQAIGTVATIPGEALSIVVGDRGDNGSGTQGGAASDFGGGGAGGDDLSDDGNPNQAGGGGGGQSVVVSSFGDIVVGGGGGGGSGGSPVEPSPQDPNAKVKTGGDGGGTEGDDGQTSGFSDVGTGGTQTAGGDIGGTTFFGGNGATVPDGQNGGGGGGGGGGFFGGGGGDVADGSAGGGGGGGSGHTPDGQGLTTGGAEPNRENGSVFLTWEVDPGCGVVPPEPVPAPELVIAPSFTG